MAGGADQGRPATTTEFVDEGHRARLEDLILRQQDEIAGLQATIERVRGLRDLSQWAAKMAGDEQRPTVLVSDLTRALEGASEGSPQAESFRR